MEDPFLSSSPKQPEAVKTTSRRNLRLWLTLGGVFLFLFILIFSSSLYFSWRKATTDDLINLAPLDSVVYVFSRESFLPWPISLINEKVKISDLPFTEFFQKTGASEIFAGLDFQNDLLKNSSQVGLVGVTSESSNLDLVFIFKLKSSELAQSFSTKLSKCWLAKENILIVSGSDSALAKVKEVAGGSIFSLGSQVNSKRLGHGLMNFYLDSDNLKSFLFSSQKPENKIFSQLSSQDIYLSLTRKNNQWQFTIDNDFLSLPKSNILIEYLPKDFSVFASGLNLNEIFSAWAQADPKLKEFFKQTYSGVKTVYDFDLNLATSFLNQSVDLIINYNQESVLGFDYILVLPSLDEKQINDFKELIKIILAQKLPKEVTYLLPDGSKATELLAATDAWQWQQDETGISYLKEDKLKFEIGYLSKDSKTIIANNLAWLKDYIVKPETSLVDLTSSSSKEGRFIIFKSSNLPEEFKVYLPSGMIIVREGRSGGIFGKIIGF